MKHVFNYRKLRGRIVEKYGSVTSFAEKYGVSKALMSLKLNNKAGFSQDDIVKISEMLEIEKTETADYFLTLQS